MRCALFLFFLALQLGAPKSISPGFSQLFADRWMILVGRKKLILRLGFGASGRWRVIR
jgi:hypothetical protein